MFLKTLSFNLLCLTSCLSISLPWFYCFPIFSFFIFFLPPHVSCVLCFLPLISPTICFSPRVDPFSFSSVNCLSLLIPVSVFTPHSIGGSIPIVFSYYSEFLAQEKRGEHLSWLCMFWMIGGIYASAMAWAIIPHYGEKNKHITQSENHCLKQPVR